MVPYGKWDSKRSFDDPCFNCLDSLDNIIVTGTSEGVSGDNFYTEI